MCEEKPYDQETKKPAKEPPKDTASSAISMELLITKLEHRGRKAAK